MRKYLFVVPIILAVLSLLLGSCSTPATTPAATTTTAKPTTPATTTTPAPTTATPKYGGTLKYADPFFPAANIGWIPDANWGGPTSYIFLEPLLRVDAKGSISPWLATKWEVSSDLKSVTLTLRQGVKFHDGSDFNATVAKWNLDQLLNAKSSAFADVNSVDIVDNYTIRLNMKNYTNMILSTLGDRFFMVSKAAFDAHGGGDAAISWMRLNPVGTGPFKLVSFTPGVSIKGVKFDGYWQKGLPYLDSIEMTGIGDPMTRAQSFLAGEQDMVAGDLTKVEYDLSQKGFPIDYKYFLAIACLVPDSKNPNSPLSNIKVRQAIDYAIDRDAIVNALGYGFWPATSQWAVPGNPAYVTDLSPRAYNPDKAKQLLTEAGYPSGFKTQILGNSVTTNKDAMSAIQGYLSKVGITVDINMVDNASYNNMILKGWDGFAAASKSINVNMNSSINVNWSQLSIQNFSLAKPDDFQALYQASAASPEYNPALVQKVIRYMYDNAMVTPLYAVSRGYNLQPYLHGLDLCNNISAMYWGTATAWTSK